MVRKEGKLQELQLDVKVPSFFRCPISLEVMQSPVSLSTGVTYDRASIQRWLDAGHTTCPATMLPLPSTDLVPNLTLRRLIQLWSAGATAGPPPTNTKNHADILRDVKSSPDPLIPLLRLADLLSDPDLDDSVKTTIVTAGECAPAIASIIIERTPLETLEAAVRVFALILTMDCIDETHKKIAASALFSDLDGSVSSLITVMKDGSRMDSKADAVRVLDLIFLFSDQDSKIKIAERPDLVPELIRLIGNVEQADQRAVDAGLACLISISTAGRRARVGMVRAGVVPAVARVLSSEATPAGAAERALRVMEAVVGCAEGRAAIGEEAEGCVGAVVGRMMKVGREGQEAAVAVLWAACHAARDPRAREAVAGVSGGVAKILLLMQGDCSPAVRRMAGDLLRVFRVDPKSCLAAYNTKTTHIMPF